jgi:stage V sporulation protein G
MEITEVRIKLMPDPSDRLLAFCSLTFDDCFAIRDLKIIQGTRGAFVAMPSRKLTDRCPRCGGKNSLRSRFCSDCGIRLQEDRACRADDGRAKLYADIAHPIHSGCRDMIQRRVIEAYHLEVERAQQPGYVCLYDDYGEESYATLPAESEELIELPRMPSAALPDLPVRSGQLRPAVQQALANAAAARENGHLVVVGRSERDDDTFGSGLVQ